MIDATVSDGLILDLQVIRPDPSVEVDGDVVARVDGEPLFKWADAATAAVDARITCGDLLEETVDEHEVRKHYADGPELLADFADSRRNLPVETIPILERLERPVVLRERCRLRLLRVQHRTPAIKSS